MKLALAAAATALLLLTACSGEPEVREPDPTTSPSPTPTAAAPTMPAQAKEDSTEGAVAFVVHWVDVLNHASETGNTEPLESASAGDCEGCAAYISLFKETYDAGGYYRGGHWKLSEIAVTRGEDSLLIYAHVDAPAGTFKTSADAEKERGTPEDSDLVFTVERRSPWVMTQVGLEDELS